MALKKKITKVEHAALPAHFQTEYKADGDNFVLDVDGEEDVGALKRAKDRETQTAKDEKLRADKAVADLAELKKTLGEDDEAVARRKGDIVTLEKAWKAKQDATEAKHAEDKAKKDTYLQRMLVDQVAAVMARDLSDTPNVLLPHIKARLQADLTLDEPVTRVLDAAGKISAMTVKELQTEIATNPDFAAIITATKGSGGGAPGGNQGGGAPRKKFADWTEAERIAYAKANPAEFKKLSDANLATQTVKL